MSDLFEPTWGPFYGNPISCILLVALWIYGAIHIGYTQLPALCCAIADWIRKRRES